MFEVDLLKEINRYREGKVSYEELRNFVVSNFEKVRSVLESSSLFDESNRGLIEEMLKKPENEDEASFLLNKYEEWKEIYEKKGVCDETWAIVNSVILKFYPFNIENLLKVREIDGDNVFKSFVSNLINGLRILMSEDVEFYLDNVYKNLNWINKIKERFKIKRIIKKIARYDFDDEVFEFIKWIRRQRSSLTR